MKKVKNYDMLMVDYDPKGSYAEAIKSVRTNLQFSSINKIIGQYSYKI